MTSEASFHAKITADASDFIAQINGATGALQSLVAQTGKAAKADATPKGSGKAAANDVKNVMSEAKRGADSLHAQAMNDIKAENAARAEGKTLKAVPRDNVVATTKRTRAEGPVRGPEKEVKDFVALIKVSDQFTAAENKRKLDAATTSKEASAQSALRVRDSKAEIAAAERRTKIVTAGAFQEARTIAAERKRTAAAQAAADRAAEAAADRRNKIIVGGAFGEARAQAAQRIKDDKQRIRDIKEVERAQVRATAAHAKMQQRELDAMVTGRYALYDMSSTYELVAAKAFMLTAAMLGTIKVAAQFETAFTSVERAMQPLPDEFDGIRSSLLAMSQEMPIAFADMAKIATLGAQMGITAGGIEEFTKNVSAFSAVTGSTIDETAQKFGRIAALADIDASDFNKLGSAVAYTGINAVATEQEILALTESIAAATRNAGFGADEIIGFAATLASLGIAPEQARGVVLRVFADITRAAETGGKQIAAFGKIAGMSAEAATTMWKSSPEQFFNSLLTGLGTVENFTQAMDSLGFTETRETNVLQRLSQNMNIYNKSMADSSKSYEEGTFLADAYAKTADNLDAKFKMLLNTLQSLGDALGSSLIGPMGEFVDLLKDISSAATEFSKTPLGKTFMPIIVSVTTLIGAFTLFKAVSFKATAQMFAMRTAMIQMGRANELAKGGMRNTILTMMGLQKAVTMTDGSIQFLTRSQYQLAASEERVAVQTAESGRVVNGWANETRRAAIGTRLFSAALTGLSVIGTVVSLASILGTFAEMNKITMDLAGSGGGLASFRDAMYADTKAVADGASYYSKYASTVTETSNVAKGYVTTLQDVTGGQTTLNSELTDVNEKISEQTLYLGENSQAWLANALANDPAILAMFEKMEASGKGAADTLNSLGVSMIELQKAALRKPGTGALDYLKGLPGIQKDLTSLQGGFSVFSRRTGGDMKKYMEYTAGLGNGSRSAAAQVWLTAYAIDGVTEAGAKNSKMMELLGVLMPTVGDEATSLAEDFSGVAKEVRTVIDYASELNGVFSRIREIKYGKNLALGEVAEGWLNIKEKATDAAEAMKAALAEEAVGRADKAVLEYQLSVAERYGDEKRAIVLRAKIADKDKDIAKSTKSATEAQDDMSTELNATTKAGIANQKTIDGMVGSYQDLIDQYIKAGITGKPLEMRINALTKQFTDNAMALGFSKKELDPYISSIANFADASSKIKPDLTVKFDVNKSAADNAVNEFKAKLSTIPGTVKTDIITNRIDKSTFDLNGLDVETLRSRAAALEGTIQLARNKIDQTPNVNEKIRIGSGITSAYAEVTRIRAEIARLARAGGIGGRANGGYISGPGTSTSDSIPTMLSNGEYVIKASAVSAYGVDFMNALNNQRVSQSMRSSVPASAGASSNVVYLSPEDRQLLRSAADRPIALYTENSKIAQSANAGNVVLAQRGMN